MRKVNLRSEQVQLLAYAEDVVAFVKEDSQVINLLKELAKLEHITSLGIKINKTKLICIEKVPKIQGKIPEALINILL
eukprot:snap_masked-scaffold_10-processed-gene-13.24-mRNA-1 protein AED:1.00 eAED:1.00 QI:0/-1/0/0/-1/1/1/0/77